MLLYLHNPFIGFFSWTKTCLKQVTTTTIYYIDNEPTSSLRLDENDSLTFWVINGKEVVPGSIPGNGSESITNSQLQITNIGRDSLDDL